MKSFFRLSIYAILIIGCTSQTSYKDKNAVPEAFDDKTVWDYSRSEIKTRGTNIIDQLWSEYLKEHPELNNKIKSLKELQEDISKHKESFQKFINNNNSYYSAAKYSREYITDTILKEQISNKLEKSELAFKKKIENYGKRSKSIAEIDKNVSDLLLALKIAKTLEMTEDYQKNTNFIFEQLDEDIKKMEEIKSYFENAL